MSCGFNKFRSEETNQYNRSEKEQDCADGQTVKTGSSSEPISA